MRTTRDREKKHAKKNDASDCNMQSRCRTTATELNIRGYSRGKRQQKATTTNARARKIKTHITFSTIVSDACAVSGFSIENGIGFFLRFPVYSHIFLCSISHQLCCCVSTIKPYIYFVRLDFWWIPSCPRAFRSSSAHFSSNSSLSHRFCSSIHRQNIWNMVECDT